MSLNRNRDNTRALLQGVGMTPILLLPPIYLYVFGALALLGYAASIVVRLAQSAEVVATVYVRIRTVLRRLAP